MIGQWERDAAWAALGRRARAAGAWLPSTKMLKGALYHGRFISQGDDAHPGARIGNTPAGSAQLFPGDVETMILAEIVDTLAPADYVGCHAYGGIDNQLMVGPQRK